MGAVGKASSLYVIEPMQLDDLGEVLQIEQQSFSNPWSREGFLYEIGRNPHSHPIVARTVRREPQAIVGYCVKWLVLDHVHIQNVAVHPAHRRRGLGRYLIEDALEAGRKAGARKAFLEVRLSNRAAQRLYASLGFHEVGRRRRYYSHPREDAILYEKDLIDVGA